MMEYIEWFVLGFPVLGALINALLGKRFSSRVQNGVACGAVVGALLAILPLLAGQLLAPGLVGRSETFSWIRVWAGTRFVEGPLSLRVDAISVLFALVTILIGLLVHWIAIGHLDDRASRHLVLAALNGTLAALLLLALADNLFVLLLGWSLTGWSLYAWRRHDPRSRLLPGWLLLSDLALLAAIGLLGQTFASLSLEDLLAQKLAAAPVPLDRTLPPAALLLVMGIAVRAALLPFQGMALQQEPLPFSIMVLNDALLTIPVAILAFVRLSPLIAQTFSSSLLLWWGIVTAIVAAWLSFGRGISPGARYVAIAQSGLMAAAVGIGRSDAALAFLIAYMIFQAMLVIGQQGDDRRNSRHWAVILSLAVMAGLPPFSGFFFYHHLLRGAFDQGLLQGISVLLAVLVTLSGTARLVWRAAAADRRTTRARHGGLLTLLAVVGLVLGTFNWTASPLVERFVAPLLAVSLPAPAWWGYVVAVCAVAAGAGVGYWRRAIPGRKQTRGKARQAAPGAGEGGLGPLIAAGKGLLRLEERLVDGVSHLLDRWTAQP